MERKISASALTVAGQRWYIVMMHICFPTQHGLRRAETKPYSNATQTAIPSLWLVRNKIENVHQNVISFTENVLSNKQYLLVHRTHFKKHLKLS